MSSRTFFVFCALSLSIFISTSATYAQTDIALESLRYITEAYENTLAVSSMVIQTYAQTDITGNAFSQVKAADFQIVRTEDGWDAGGTLESSMSTPNGELLITTEIAIVDGRVYIRLNNVPSQMPQGTSLPDDWFEVITTDETQVMISRIAGVDIDDPISNVLGALTLPVQAESVSSLTELPGDTINDQPMRVFQLTLETEVVIETGMATILHPTFSGFGGGAAGGFSGGRPQQNAGTPNPPELNPANLQITFAVYIGEEDHLIHRIYSVVVMSDLEATTTTITDFSNHDLPVEVIVPEITNP